MKRLPIFILVDTSGKMQGERIEIVNKKINELISNLRLDPYALGTVNLFIASYDMDMTICIPLTELVTIDLPILKAKPSTPSMLGNALSSLDSIFEKIIKKPTAEAKGDFSAVLYIITGGKPSDSASAHDSMEQILIKRQMKLCVGVTTSSLVPFYENLFDFNIPTGEIVITDLNTADEKYWIDIYSYMDESVSDLTRTTTLLPPPPKEIHISF